MRLNNDYDDPATENIAWAEELRRPEFPHENPPDFLTPQPEPEKTNEPIETETK